MIFEAGFACIRAPELRVNCASPGVYQCPITQYSVGILPRGFNHECTEPPCAADLRCRCSYRLWRNDAHAEVRTEFLTGLTSPFGMPVDFLTGFLNAKGEAHDVGNAVWRVAQRKP